MLIKLDENNIDSYIQKYADKLNKYIIDFDPMYQELKETLTESRLRRYLFAKMKFLVAQTKLAYARMHKDDMSYAWNKDDMKLMAQNPMYTVSLVVQIQKCLDNQKAFYNTAMDHDNLVSLVSKDIQFY